METIPLNTTNIYVMKLQDDCWYVGKTEDIPKDIKRHFTQTKIPWMLLHKPIFMESCYRNASPFDEDRYTKEYMLKYGVDKVRGGTYTAPYLAAEQRQAIQRELWGVQGLCIVCGEPHASNECPSKSVDKSSETEPFIQPRRTFHQWFRDAGACAYEYLMDFLTIPH